MATEDFDYGLDEQPKKGFMGGLFTKREKDVMIDPRSRKMPQSQPISDDIMKLLGGQYKGPEDQNMALDYVGNSYVSIGESYKPISETYKGDPYVSAKYEPLKYESPGYESASGALFGEQGKAWEDSPVFKQYSGGLFQDTGEKSSLYNPTGMSGVLFGNKEQTPNTGRPEEFPMRLPDGSLIPYQKATLPNSFQPNPLFNAAEPPVLPPPVIMGQSVPQYIPPTTQGIPPQYVPSGQTNFKRPVGRPRLNKPKLPKRPVGRPRKNAEMVSVPQMTEVQ